MKELRRYNAELKAEAVKMVTEQGLTHEETGKRLSIPKGNIGNRVGAAKAATAKGSPAEQSVGQLRSKNARLRKDLAESGLEGGFQHLETGLLRRFRSPFAIKKIGWSRSLYREPILSAKSLPRCRPLEGASRIRSSI
jgi:transposase-like protein